MNENQIKILSKVQRAKTLSMVAMFLMAGLFALFALLNSVMAIIMSIGMTMYLVLFCYSDIKIMLLTQQFQKEDENDTTTNGIKKSNKTKY